MLQHLRCLLIAALGFGALAGSAISAAAADTTVLEAIRARGYLLCGIGEPQPGFSNVGAGGERTGLDVEFCSALAAAVFGSKDAVKLWPLSANDRFKALQAGDVGRAGAGGHMDAQPRYRAGGALHGGAVLRRPGLPHPAGQCGCERARAFRGLHMCAAGGHGRAGRCELLRRPADAVPDRFAGQLGRPRQSLCGRQLHGPDGRYVAPGRGAQQTEDAGRPHHPARAHYQGAARSCGASGRSPVVSPSSGGR